MSDADASFGGSASSGGSSGSAGDGSAGELASAGAGGEALGGVACDFNWTDCDGSSLTICETNVIWEQRHCGGCGQPCNGLCFGGTCKEATLVATGVVASMVASHSTGFAVVSVNAVETLFKIDVRTGQSVVYLDGVDSDLELSISADRVYFWDYHAVELRSARLDGTDLVVEDVSHPVSVGGTSHGVYYVSSVWNASTSESEYGLWFRASGETAWKKLFDGDPGRILASSAYGVVLARGDDETFLDLYRGEELTELGPAPTNLKEVAATSDRVVVLTHDAATNRHELWWLDTSGERVSYEVTEPSNYLPELVVDGQDTVVMYFEHDGTAFLQSFTEHGIQVGRAGLPTQSVLALVDLKYAWYSVIDDFLNYRFLRTERTDFRE